MIYTNAAEIRINIQDVTHAIQWKISDYLILVTLLHWIGKTRRDKTLLIVFILFIDSKYVFLDDIASMSDSPFSDYKTAIEPHDRVQAAKIISTLYKNNF